jgi:hypothetical protein
VDDPAYQVGITLGQLIGADGRWGAMSETSALIERVVTADPDHRASIAALEVLRRARMRTLNTLLTQRVEREKAAVDEWIRGGFVSRPQALDLIEFPDIDAWQQLENANLDLVRWQIEGLVELEEGEQAPLPIENQDIPMAVKLVNQAFLVAYRMQAPPHVQLGFQTYLSYAKKLMDKLKAEEAAQAAPPPEAMGPAALDPNAAAAAQLAGPPAGMAA